MKAVFAGSRRAGAYSWDNKAVAHKARELEQRLERTDHELRLLQRISRYLASDRSMGSALDSIVSMVVEFTSCDSCLVYLKENSELVLCAASSEGKQSSLGTVRLRIDEGLTGWVARENKFLALSCDAYNDPRFKSFSELVEDTYEAFLSAPIVARGRVIGVINVQHRQAHNHSGDEMELISTIAQLIGCLAQVIHTKPDTLDMSATVAMALSTAVARSH